MELLVTNENHFARSHMWFKHGEKLEHIVAKRQSHGHTIRYSTTLMSGAKSSEIQVTKF